ncbi:MAG: hypothetical protein PQJ59_01630 [Spirochaetales bacterium]|nr:hypothetical protein [Spirochaetales bacterium]
MTVNDFLNAINQATEASKDNLESKGISRKVEKLEKDEMKSLEADRYREHNKGLHDTYEMRRKLAYRIFWVVTGTLIFDGVFILLHGAVKAIWNLILYSDTVIIAILSSTTVSVIGLVAIVLHNLFPNLDGNKKKTE